MAVYVPATNTVELVLQQAMSGQLIDNVLNFEFAAPLTVAILEDLAEAAIAAWIASMTPELSENLDLNAVKATDLTTSSSSSVVVPAPADTDGAAATNANPLNVACCISEQTPLRGRSYRGRYYQAGTPTDILADRGSITTAYQAALLGDFVEFISSIEAAVDCVHVVLSRIQDGNPLMSGITTPISTYSLNVDLDSQRRRLKGRGA